MEIRSFTVPFSEIVGPEATEIAYGPDDACDLRSLYAYPASEVTALVAKIQSLNEESPAEDAAAVIEDLLAKTIVGWRLNGPNGPIPKPTGSADIEALPVALAVRLVQFLARFRGRPDPTPAG